MAVHASITVPAAAPTPSRRAMLSALAIGPLASAFAMASGVSAASAAPIGDTAGIRPEFLARLDAITRARDYARWYEANVWVPTKARNDALAAEVPHVSFTSGLNVLGEPLSYSTANPSSVSACERIVAGANGRRDDSATGARRLLAAHKRRQRRIACIDRETGWDAVADQDEANSAAWADASTAFYTMVAASFAELALKIETLHAAGDFHDNCVADAILADVRAITSRGA